MSLVLETGNKEYGILLDPISAAPPPLVICKNSETCGTAICVSMCLQRPPPLSITINLRTS